MKTFRVDRRLDASPEAVWRALTDASRLAGGSLGITRLDGRIAAGERIVLWTEATGSRPFRLRVGAFEPARRMTWTGGLPLGLFRGVRTFTLAPDGAGTRFEMAETFSGLLSPLIERSIPDLTPSFERFADGLAVLAKEPT